MALCARLVRCVYEQSPKKELSWSGRGGGTLAVILKRMWAEWAGVATPDYRQEMGRI